MIAYNFIINSFVTSNREDALRSREVRVRNEFPVPVHISRIDFGPDVEQYFEVSSKMNHLS